MTSITIKAFRGKVPRTSERLLQANFATEALNCKITSGRLDPLKGLTKVHTSLAASIATMFRYRFQATDYWMVWPRVVDAVRSPTAQDTLGRVFYTGDGSPRMTTFADGISGAGPFPAGFYTLGVYIPTVAPTLAVVGGTGASETRAYAYAFATQYGEESGLSPAVVLSGLQNGSWNLSAMEVAPPNSGTVTGAATVSAGVVEVTLNTARGLAVYEEITFAGITGMTSLNGTWPIAAVNLGTNKVQVLLTTAQTYTAGGTWARKAPHNVSSMTRRIYRTVGTNVDYKLVAEIPASTATYNDTVASTALGSGPTVAADSLPPPKNGHSLVALANGALAMLAGNELCLSESYKPHSWPLGNRYAFSGLGVALVAAGTSAIVLTDGFPVVATATVPEAVSLAYLEDSYAPCISKRGVVDAGNGAVFPSHDGLWLATPGGGRNVTRALYRTDEWKKLNPATFRAAMFDGCYYAIHDGGTGEASRILVLDLGEADSATEVNEQVDALYRNNFDGKLYVAKGNALYEWDSDDANRYLAFWQSPEFQLGPPVNFSMAQVHARYDEIVPTDTHVQDANALLLANANNIKGALGATPVGVYPIAGSNLQEVPVQTRNRVQFSILVGGNLVFTRELNSSKAFRLPAGFKSESYTVQIAASIPVYQIAIAQGAQELKGASQ